MAEPALVGHDPELVPEVWRQSFVVRSYEVGPNERASLLTVADYFQEAAVEHARSGGLETFDLGTEGGIWVLNRMKLRVERLPEMRETVEVETWPRGRAGLRAFRDYRLRGADGADAVVGTSAWFVIDLARRRPVRLPEGLERFGPREPEEVLAFGDPPQAPAEAEHHALFTVRRSDLDRVGHANNVRFVEWALEALPTEAGFLDIDIQFHAEATLGDVVASEAGPLVEGARDHRLSGQADGRTLALARTLWSP